MSNHWPDVAPSSACARAAAESETASARVTTAPPGIADLPSVDGPSIAFFAAGALLVVAVSLLTLL